MTQGGDWNPTDDDDPRAPPRKANGKGRGKAPAMRVVASGERDEALAWRGGLALDGKERVTKDAGNAALVLLNSEWRDACRHNEFADRIVVAAVPGFARKGGLPPPPPGELGDEHATYAGLWLAKREGVSWKEEAVRKALVYTARQNGFNPLTDYLDGCASLWDRRPRIGEWLSNYAGVERSVYSVNAGRMWMISAVARAYKPGEQVDHMLILEGDQGEKKTTLARVLASGVDGAFLAKLPALRDAERAAFAIQGRWICEVGELDALRGASATAVKDFMTIRDDTYRPPYGHFYVTRGRTIVFIGTTNHHAYLGDETGARRFWPVRVSKIDREALERDRDQLWGEAVFAFRRGEQWWPTDDLVPAFTVAQRERFESDEWEPKIQAYLAGREWVLPSDCLQALGMIEAKDWTDPNVAKARRTLRHLGWIPHQSYIDGVKARRWYAPGTELP